MRKIFVWNLISIDGYFADPDGEIDWHNVDQEFNEAAIEMLKSVDTILFGRITYQMMADYWSSSIAQTDDPIVAGFMNTLPKIVFSKTLEKVEWNNSILLKSDLENEIKRIKEQNGKDIAILGSGTIVQYLTNLGLIDEYKLIVNPIILGKGKSMFNHTIDRINLKLKESKQFRSGNVLLHYERK